MNVLTDQRCMLERKGFTRVPSKDWAGRGTGNPLHAWRDRLGRLMHFEAGITLFWGGERGEPLIKDTIGA